MVEVVTGLKKKSFKNYTGPAEKFKHKNVIFGYNGRGKSSLALGIRDEFLLDSQNTVTNIRFFNQDYVDESLTMQDPTTGKRQKIKGVIAHFGTKDVKIEEEIANLQKKSISVEPLRERLAVLTTDTRKAIDSIHDKRKGTASIQKAPRDAELMDIIRYYGADLDKAKRIEPDENKLSKIQGDNLLGEQIERLKAISFESFDGIASDDITQAKEIFEKTFEKMSIPSSDVVDWLNAGLALHKEGDNCKFCGNPLALRELVLKIDGYNKNEKQKAVKSLQALNNKLAQLQNTIKRNLDKKAIIRTVLEDDTEVTEYFSKIEQGDIRIASIRSLMEAKIKNIDDFSLIFVDFASDLANISAALEALNKSRSNQLAKVEKQNNNKNLLVKGAIGLEIARDSNIQSKLTEIKTIRAEIDNAEKSNAIIEGQIHVLKQSESATADFAAYISDILESLNIHLRLIVSNDGKNYIIQHTKTSKDLMVADISEGERNLLALLFFYYELFDDDKQSSFKNDIRLLVVDDPISSVDDINKMYIIELVKQMLNLPAPQVFVMTHCWEDFTSICYGMDDKPTSHNAFFEIIKDTSGSSTVVKTRANITPYHHNFIDVYNFSQKADTTNLDDCDIYHLPNIMRQVLEGFLTFKIRNSSPTKKNEQGIARVLFDDEWSTISEKNKAKLGQLLLVTNVNSHNSSRSPDEILGSAKFLMSRIRITDHRHFSTNTEPINA